MPCSTDQGQDRWFDERYGTNNPDKLRGMLCQCCLTLEVAGAILTPEIKEWWEKHKKWDMERKK